MISLNYLYLIAVLLSSIPWAILYLARKDLRKEMFAMGIIVCIMGLIGEYFWWSKDWWHPQTITGTRGGLEDILNGFFSGGIAVVLYEEIFKKRLYKYKRSNHDLAGLIMIAGSLIIILLLTSILRLNSALATIISFTFLGLILVLLRKDLLLDAIITGFCLTIAVAPAYFILGLIFPGYISKMWTMNELSGIVFLGIPVEDLIFYFLSGFFIAPFYLYWKNEKLR